MDIQKLEKFEDWFATRYPNVQKTIDLHNDHESIVFRNNQAEAWQAAKAQAIPDGFVLVPKQPTPKMIDATWNFDEEIQDMSHNSRNEFIYNAMIAAAQEQSQ